eukprot:GEMP01010683.1.p1 GENE.GEMP01010683.1~~GEMP01010683.1.p1  ORF type:complete len:489 (+),score=84.27 GEMP01010683.1:215-1681(+)
MAAIRHNSQRRSSAGIHGMQITNDCIRQMPMFAGCDPAFLDRIALDATIHMYSAGDVIVNEGDVGETMFIINRGEVEVLVDNSEGDQQRVTTLQDGDFFGEIALLGLQARRAATVRAISFVDTRKLVRALFLRALKMFPYEKALFEAEACRRFLASRVVTGTRGNHRNSLELHKKSAMLSKLIQFGNKSTCEIDEAKNLDKDRRCLSSLMPRHMSQSRCSLDLNSDRQSTFATLGAVADGSDPGRKKSRSSMLTALPSSVANEDNRRLSNVGKMKMFGNKRMSISQGMGRTRRWSVCGSGGLAVPENSLCIMPTIAAESDRRMSDMDNRSVMSFADDRIDLLEHHKNSTVSSAAASFLPFRPKITKGMVASQMRTRMAMKRVYPVIPPSMELPSSVIPDAKVTPFAVRWIPKKRIHRLATTRSRDHPHNAATYTSPLEDQRIDTHAHVHPLAESFPQHAQFVHAFSALFRNTARVHRWPRKSIEEECV